MRIQLIANPISGGDARPQIEQALRCLEKYGATVELVMTATRGDARSTAKVAVTAGFDRIVAVGGDGTLSEVVNGVYPAQVPIAFLPTGTVNVFALEAGIPRSVPQACTLAMSGTPQRISVGRINGELFLLMASAGWDAEAVFRLRPAVKRIIGRAAYGVGALEALLAGPPKPLEIVLPDGENVTGYGVVISNCRYYGGRFLVTPQASMFSDTFEICLLRQPGRRALLTFAARLALHKPLCQPLVAQYTARSVVVQGEDLFVQVDGDAWGRQPVTVECLPRAVTMVLPREGGDAG